MPIAPGITFPYPGAASPLPAGYTRVSALDDRYVRQISGAVNPGGTGGNATHLHALTQHGHTYTHNHAGSWGASSSSAGATNSQVAGAFTGQVHHTHATSSSAAAPIAATNNIAQNYDTQPLEPLHVTVIFIQSDGTPKGVPPGALCFFNGAAPAGFAAYANAANRVLKGAAAAAGGGALGGTDPVNHTHTSATHTHPVGGNHVHALTLDVFSNTTTFNNALASSLAHTHALGNSQSQANPANSDSASDTTGNGDSTPLWHKLRIIERTATRAGVERLVYGIWNGTLATVPGGWQVGDGTNGTVDTRLGRFVRGAAADGEANTTGGNATHTHAVGAGHAHGSTGAHQHSSSLTSGGPSNGGGNAGMTTIDTADAATNVHTHGPDTYTSTNVTIGSTDNIAPAQNANSSNEPVFTTVAYIALVEAAPNAPTINVPLDSVAYSGSIGLDATVSDGNGDACYATFEYDRSDGNWTIIGDGSTVASGGRSVLQWDISALQPATNYRVRAKTVEAHEVPSAYTTTGAFTIGPGFAGLFADDLTAKYSATDLSTRYYADSLVGTYKAVKS